MRNAKIYAGIRVNYLEKWVCGLLKMFFFGVRREERPFLQDLPHYSPK